MSAFAGNVLLVHLATLSVSRLCSFDGRLVNLNMECWWQN